MTSIRRSSWSRCARTSSSCGTSSEIPVRVRRAFQSPRPGEPGPVAVVIPYNLLIEAYHYNDPPLAPCGLPWDEAGRSVGPVLALPAESSRSAFTPASAAWTTAAALQQVAELLQAPVATSVSGKGVIPECHPLAVGWGFGPQGTQDCGGRLSIDRPASGHRREVQRGFHRLLLRPAAGTGHSRRRQSEQPGPRAQNRRLRAGRCGRIPVAACSNAGTGQAVRDRRT